MSTADQSEERRPDRDAALERSDPARLLRISDADRQQVAEVLHVAVQEGRLTFEELEDRLTTVYAAKTYAELEPITHDLPGGMRRAASRAEPDRAPARHPSTHSGPATSIGIMSGCDRAGGWTVPESHTAFAMMGGVRLDLREARFAAAQVTIRCIAIMGGITVIVPEDMDVECDGIGIMGGFGHRSGSGFGRGPHVRIVGVAFWGGVSIQRAKPGADLTDD